VEPFGQTDQQGLRDFHRSPASEQVQSPAQTPQSS
jgi:hypothetical protein